MGGGGKIGRHRALSVNFFLSLFFSALSRFALPHLSSLFSLLSKRERVPRIPHRLLSESPPPFRAASSSFDLASQPRAEARVAKNQRKKEQRLRSGIKKTRWRPPLHRAAPSLPRTPPGTPPSTWVSGGPSTARWVGSSPPQCSFVSSA